MNIRRCRISHRFMVLFSIFCFFALSICLSNKTSATTQLSLTVSNNVVELNAAPTRSTGTFVKSSNVNISTSTNNQTGYTLSIAASSSTDYNKLKNGNEALTSVASATTEEAFSALNSTAYNGKWGYLPSKHNSEANTDFLPAPPASGDILDVTDSANSVANNYTLAIGARVDSSVKVGTYSNTYNVILVANAIPYTIIYDDNVVSSMPTDIDSTSMSSTVNISSTTPTRDGYSFLGWCTVIPTNTNGVDSCAGGTQYSAGQAWTLDGSTSNVLHLYAMWGKSIGQCSNINTCMQFVDRYRLASLMPSNGSSTTLYDMRDGQAYTVAKLGDSQYWMTKNLNLAGETTLSSDDTDIPDGYTLPTVNNFQSGNRLPASSTTGFNDNTKAFVYNSNSTTCGNNSPCYSYYSWTAATLGSGLSISSENTDAPYSICPKGWRLPTSGNHLNNGWKRGDFYHLITSYGVNLNSNYYDSTATFYNSAGAGTAANFLLSGHYTTPGSFRDGGSYGYYWSSTSTGSSSNARYLRPRSSSVGSADYADRYNGFSVRCIFSG